MAANLGGEPLRHGSPVRFLKALFKLFKKKPVLIQMPAKLENPAIFIANHSGAGGPITYTMYMPVFFMPWGAHAMTEGIKARWNYLFHIFYKQKLKYGTLRSWILATLFSPFSGLLYRSVHLIPSYEDTRLISTVRQSMKQLLNNRRILIYPEDSSEGYQEKPERFLPGFVLLAKVYRKKTGIDIPVYPVRYSRSENTMVIGAPQTLGRFFDAGEASETIAERCRKILNALNESSA